MLRICLSTIFIVGSFCTVFFSFPTSLSWLRQSPSSLTVDDLQCCVMLFAKRIGTVKLPALLPNLLTRRRIYWFCTFVERYFRRFLGVMRMLLRNVFRTEVTWMFRAVQSCPTLHKPLLPHCTNSFHIFTSHHKMISSVLKIWCIFLDWISAHPLIL